jgi:hypothetical protein
LSATDKIVRDLVNEGSQFIPSSIRELATNLGIDNEAIVDYCLELWSREFNEYNSRPTVYPEREYDILSIGHDAIIMALRGYDFTATRDHLLRLVVLVGNTVTAILAALFMIAKHISTQRDLPGSVSSPAGYGNHTEWLRLFVDCAWGLFNLDNRNEGQLLCSDSGLELGTEIAITKNSSIALPVEDGIWMAAPFYHPLIKMPGSPWNKFFMNQRQEVFDHKWADTQIQVRFPESVHFVADAIGDHYFMIKLGFINVS